MNIRIIRDIFIFCLSVWAILTVVSFYFDVYIIFPFTLTESDEIPYENLIAIRLAMFATFAFYLDQFPSHPRLKHTRNPFRTSLFFVLMVFGVKGILW